MYRQQHHADVNNSETLTRWLNESKDNYSSYLAPEVMSLFMSKRRVLNHSPRELSFVHSSSNRARDFDTASASMLPVW